jgi:hypothetical protein
MVNAIGQLDVDIILDEAPDAVTIQGQSFEFLQALGPQFIQQHPDIAVELSPLDSATKKKIRDKQAQAQQAQQPMQEVQMAGAQEEIKNVAADTQLKQAQAMKAMVDAEVAPLQAIMDGQQPGPMMQPQEYEVPPELQNAQAMADIENTQADTDQKRAAAYKAQQEGALAPQKMAMEAQNAQADRQLAARNADADRKIAAKKATQKPTQAKR